MVPALQAEQTFTTHVTANAGLTIAGDTDFSGPVWIGRLMEDSTAKGFKMDVFQDAQTYYEEVYHDSSYVTSSQWVEDGYYDIQSTWVEVYDWVNHGYMTPDEVDETGNIINPGTWMDDWQWEYVGTQDETSSVWVSNGGHYEPYEEWQAPYYESVPHTSYGAPEVRFTGTRSNTTWEWSNPTSGATDSQGTNRALLTHSSLEQSYTSPEMVGPYQSYGSKVGKQKIELWSNQGTNYEGTGEPGSANSVEEYKAEAELNPIELILSSSESSDGGLSMVRSTTTLTATSASFAGSVGIKGVLRVKPAGDLSMGQYTNGVQP
ncbi:MAG: hypothetical protein B7Z37_04765 [Verrucomicrobia bacterium 12-59-8]|nr:MAG: hypothetical protein B7Z37_04765 [Verrucomicrobia bacterium 12-59-8]